jgi:hypothetical protein
VAFGLWGLTNGYAALGASSLVTAALLGLYGGYFFQKIRKLALVAFLVTATANPAFACPVCFGAADSPAVDGMRMAIIALLAITVTVLGSFAAFFVYLMRRARTLEAESPTLGAGAHEGSY